MEGPEGELLDDGVRGAYPPYLVVGTTGAVYEIDPVHVVRDLNSAYPVLSNEWAHMCETGKHAFWNSEALMWKPSRQLMPKPIVVLRTDLDNTHYLWCVRMRVELYTWPNGVGDEFLWPLSCTTAGHFYDRLEENPHMAHSSLVQYFCPCAHDLFPEQLIGARRLDRLEHFGARVLLAGLNVVTHDVAQPISWSWLDAGALRGAWCRPLRPGAASRRSARLAGPPLVDTLGRDLLTEVIGHLLQPFYLSARLYGLATVLDVRLVCHAFNALVGEGMQRACQNVLRLCRLLRTDDWLEHVYAARATLTWAGICTFRAMEEQSAVDALGREPTRRETMQLWMRLLCGKAPGARPPSTPKPFQAMVCVHGETTTTASGHGTRRQRRKRVRFRLLAPQCLVAALETRGWRRWDAPESKCESGGLW